MPAAPPPTPVSHGLKALRYPGGLEGMASPSHRYTGAHLPTSFPTQHYGMKLPLPCCCADWQYLLGCLGGHLCEFRRFYRRCQC